VLRAPLRRSLRLLVGACLLVAPTLLLACSDKPSAPVVTGAEFEHPEADFSLTVPEGWQRSISRAGVSLVRTLPYGGGYPTISVRRLDDDEGIPLTFDGSSFENGQSRLEYRYQRWHNPRGSGYRLEVYLSGSSLNLFVEASVWDPARALNRKFFEQAFWPIINSIRAS
jgi:hypothetical protein